MNKRSQRLLRYIVILMSFTAIFPSIGYGFSETNKPIVLVDMLYTPIKYISFPMTLIVNIIRIDLSWETAFRVGLARVTTWSP
jgi:hypothetical protein